MKSAAPLVLFPNFAGEEQERAQPLATALHPLARGWAALFGRRATVQGVGEVDGDERGAAFSFLDALTGFVPWFSTGEARARAHTLSLPYASADPDATQTVHDKAFAVSQARLLGLMPDCLEPFVVVLSPADLLAPDFVEHLLTYVRKLPAFARGFTLKPRSGTSGRGRVPGLMRILDDERARTACVNGAKKLAVKGGAILEPWLTRRTDFSAHVHVTDDGPHALGVTTMDVSSAGVWSGTRFALDEEGVARADHPLHDALLAVGLQMGARAKAHGYRGPLGIDAFTFVDDRGREILRPLVEVNARFTGGLVAIGTARRAKVAPGVHVRFDARDASLSLL
jgi:hypothetical protein